MGDLILVKPFTTIGINVAGIRIGSYSGVFKQSASFPVSLRNGDDNEVHATVVNFTKEEYDAWTDDTKAEDVILAKLNLERA